MHQKEWEQESLKDLMIYQPKFGSNRMLIKLIKIILKTKRIPDELR